MGGGARLYRHHAGKLRFHCGDGGLLRGHEHLSASAADGVRDDLAEICRPAAVADGDALDHRGTDPSDAALLYLHGLPADFEL